MVKNISFIFILFFSLSVGAEGEGETSEWSQHFAGEPLPGILANIKDSQQDWPIRQWIQGYDSCKDSIDQLWDQLDLYEKLFKAQDYSAADQLSQQIIKAQYASGDCSQALWSALLVKSALLGPKVQKPTLDPDAEEKNEEDEETGKKSFFEQKEGPPKKAITVGSDDENWKPIDPNHIYTDYRYEFSLMVLFLANKGLIQKLNPHLRHVIAGDYPDSLWTHRNDEGYYTVAFFDCYSSMVFIDSDLKPFNLAATLYHELDHFFRDKFYDGIWGGHVFDLDEDSMRNFVEVDELIATVSSGFYQRRFLQVDQTFQVNDIGLGNEFNFYSQDGPLNESFRLIFADENFLSQFPNPSGFFAGLSNYQSLNGSSKSVDSILCEMQERVLKGYFSESLGGECGSNQLQDYRELAQTFLDPKLATIANMRGRRLSPWDPQLKPEEVLAQLEEYFVRLNYATQEPSHLCKTMMEEQGGGELVSYLGSQLSVDGGRTGNGGVRPWLLPSVMVPLKPGESTLRPSTFGIRACTRVRF